MKKLALAVLLVALVGTLAFAAGETGTLTGNLTYAPTSDVQGAHENGGRGCAGCHAPHSGGRGSGGDTIAASMPPRRAQKKATAACGAPTPMPSTHGATSVINFDGTYTATLTNLTWASGSLYMGVATCLSCHDGNVSKGAMMSDKPTSNRSAC